MPFGAGTIGVIGELISSVTRVVVEAYIDKDPEKLQRVTDVLSPNDPLRIQARKALEEEKTREALEAQDKRRNT